MITAENWPNYRLPLLLLLLLLGWFGALHLMELRGEEPRRALVAWEMFTSGNYLQPTIQGEPYYNKPPLFNWLIAGFYWLFGTANWVVRLPSLLAYVLWGYVNFRVVSHYINRETALYATLFFFTAAHYLFFGTVLAGELDLLYGFIVYVQGIVIFHYYQQQRWLPLFLLSYLLVSVGFMTKGIPSIAYQGLTLVGLALCGRWVFGHGSSPKNTATLKSPTPIPSGERTFSVRWLFSWQHLLGAILGLTPVVGYFWYYHQQHGNGLLYLFNLLEEASQKSVAESKLTDILKHLFELPFQFLIDHLPWILILPYGLWKGWHKPVFEHPFLRFCLLFFGINVLLYWLSPGTRIRYFYGLVPFLFIPLAYWLDKHRPLSQRVIWAILFVLAGARIVYNYTLLPYQNRTAGTVQLYQQITADALKYADQKPLFTCCETDTIFVDPSIAGVPLLHDTIIIPMYTPYQIPFILQRARGQVVPFVRQPDQPGIYLSTDRQAGKLLETYQVWDDKTLYLFEVE